MIKSRSLCPLLRQLRQVPQLPLLPLWLASAVLLWPGAAALAGPFSATYTVQLSVDASKARPQTATDRALVKAAAALGTFEIGTVSDSGILRSNDLRLRSIATGNSTLRALLADDKLDVVRTSEAQWLKTGLATTRYTDRRGGSPQLVYTADLRKGSYELRRGGKLVVTEKLAQPAVDSAALPYMFLGRAPPSAPFSVTYTDAKSLRVTGFRPSADMLTVAGQAVPVTRITSVPRTPSDPLIEIWIRNADGFPLRVRLGLAAEYGAVADQRINSLPPVVKPG